MRRLAAVLGSIVLVACSGVDTDQPSARTGSSGSAPSTEHVATVTETSPETATTARATEESGDPGESITVTDDVRISIVGEEDG